MWQIPRNRTSILQHLLSISYQLSVKREAESESQLDRCGTAKRFGVGGRHARHWQACRVVTDQRAGADAHNDMVLYCAGSPAQRHWNALFPFTFSVESLSAGAWRGNKMVCPIVACARALLSRKNFFLWESRERIPHWTPVIMNHFFFYSFENFSLPYLTLDLTFVHK